MLWRRAQTQRYVVQEQGFRVVHSVWMKKNLSAIIYCSSFISEKFGDECYFKSNEKHGKV